MTFDLVVNLRKDGPELIDRLIELLLCHLDGLLFDLAHDGFIDKSQQVLYEGTILCLSSRWKHQYRVFRLPCSYDSFTANVCS